MFIAAIFTVVKIRRQPQCPPIYKWIKRIYMYTMCVCIYTSSIVLMSVYTYTDAYNGILLNNKKNMRSSSFARTWVDLEGIRISEKKK